MAGSIDSSRWKAYHNTYGDGNNELACLTPNNVSVANGYATITSKKENIACPSAPVDEYSSGFLGSREAGKYYPLYGRYEARVRFNHAQGMWPAFWLRHRNGSGVAEVDVLEVFHNQVPGKITQTLHFPTTVGRNIWKKTTAVEAVPPAGSTGGWHTYAVEISPVAGTDGSTDIKFEFLIDNTSTGAYVHTAPEGWNTADPNASWDIAVNQAVGGNWVGHPEKQLGYLPYPNKCSLTYSTPTAGPESCPTTGIQYAKFPARYDIDHVRVYSPPTGSTLGLVQPNAGNTGVPEAASLSRVDGNVVVTEPGTVLENLDIHGFVQVRAENTVIRNSIIRGGVATGDTGLVNVTTAGASLMMEDSTLIPESPSYRIDGVRGSNFTLRRVDISGTVDGIHIHGSTEVNDGGNVRVESSWLHDFVFYENDPRHSDGSHNDAIQVIGGKNIEITGNTLTGARNAAVQVTQGRNVVGNLTLDRNWADQGGALSTSIVVPVM